MMGNMPPPFDIRNWSRKPLADGVHRRHATLPVGNADYAWIPVG